MTSLPGSTKKPKRRPADLTLPAQEFLRCLRTLNVVRCSDGARPMIEGVRIEHDGKVGRADLVSTDGYRLACTSVPSKGRTSSVTMPGPLVLRICKAFDRRTVDRLKDDATVSVRETGGWVVVKCGRTSERAPVIEKHPDFPHGYPDWRKIVETSMPAKRQTALVALDPDYLADVAKLSREWHPPELSGPERAVRCHPALANKANTFELVDGDRRLTYLLMPVRLGPS